MMKILSAASVLLVGSVFLASARPLAFQDAQQGAAVDPDGPLFARMCSDCHDSDRVVSQRRSRTEWEEVINKMLEKGATGTEAEFNKVFEYLQRNYGKVA